MFTKRQWNTMFMAVLFVVLPNWKLLKYSPTVQWINKLCCAHKIKCYTAQRMNKLLLNNDVLYLILNERNQTQKPRYVDMYEDACRYI